MIGHDPYWNVPFHVLDRAHHYPIDPGLIAQTVSKPS
jgi:hypothetical protein